MKLELPPQITSSQDVTELILQLKEYRSWLARQSVKKQVKAKLDSAPTLPPEAQTLIAATSGRKEPTPKQLDTLIDELEVLKETAATVTITLAAPPGPHHKQQLTGWCRKELHPELLVNFSFDRTLLGGMVLRLGSHIHDWSFRRQLMDQPADMKQVLKHV